MAGRGGTTGRGKGGAKGRGGRRDTPPWQRRVDRDHGGPPTRVSLQQQAIQKQRADALTRRDTVQRAVRQRAVLIQATLEGVSALTQAPLHPILMHSAGSASQPTPRATLPARATSVPVIVPVTPVRLSTPETGSRGRPWSLRTRLALVALAGPGALAALIASLATPTSTPPAITPPTATHSQSVESDLAIRQRIHTMTPPVRLATAAPTYPESVRIAAAVPSAAVPVQRPVIALPRLAFALPVEPPDVPQLTTPPPANAASAAQMAALSPASTSPRSTSELAVQSPLRDASTTDDGAAQPSQCRAPATTTLPALAEPPAEVLGLALAARAFEQVQRFVVYDARYTRIAYPGGDVASMHGVCTDVVIRAYRALGIDLQRAVYESRVGVGDTSIDHRRTETLRRFFAVHGETLPATTFAEDYEPGDIVTYHRPQNRISTAHIAIVSDRIGPSGRPMIIHNRGNGIQIEDALFVDRVTGHYRYAGPSQAAVAMARGGSSKGAIIATAGSQRGTAATVVRAAAKSPAAHKLAVRTGGALVMPSPAAVSRIATAPSMLARPIVKSP